MKGDFIMGKLREQMKMDLELQSSKQVLEYLGRYSHRVAISNHRLVKVEDGKVTWSKSDIMGCSATAIEKTSSGDVRRFWEIPQTGNSSQPNQLAGRDCSLS